LLELERRVMTVDLSHVLEPPEKRVLAEDVAARLRAAILQGHFAPGERLREERLARALGVSRGPVREALGQLERQGLVVIFRNRGAVVAQLSREDLEELYTLRLAIEDLAVRRATRFAGDAEIAQFDAIISAMVEATERGVSESEAAELDLQLHDLIYKTAKHRRLQETWANMRPQIHILLLSRNVGHEDFREMLLTSHQDIVGAMRDRDEDQAAAFIREHLAGSYERVAQSLAVREQDQQAGSTDGS
jgi:DNA-binding GntR family transcriptional regulator